jgi:hypothetical protein
LESQTYLTLKEASEYLGIDSMQLSLLISEGKLCVGLYAKNWHGIAIPNPQTVKGKLVIHPYNVSSSGEREFLVEYININDVAKRRFFVQECEVSQFWFLDSDCAISIINSTKPKQSDIVFLKPFDEIALKNAEPKKFPFDNFMVELSKTYIELEIQQQDLRMLKSDLDLINTSNKVSKVEEVDCVTSFNIPDTPDEMAILMEERYFEYLKENSDNTPTPKVFWGYMKSKSKPSDNVHYNKEFDCFRLDGVNEKRDKVAYKAYQKRYASYRKP